MILLARGRFGATATRVMEPLRVHGPITREADRRARAASAWPR